MPVNKIANYFVPLEHEVEYTQGDPNSTYNMISRIDSFLVTNSLSGDVTITTIAEGQGNVSLLTSANIFAEYTFPATAFKEGEIYNMYVKKVSYANAADQSSAPFIALV